MCSNSPNFLDSLPPSLHSHPSRDHSSYYGSRSYYVSTAHPNQATALSLKPAAAAPLIGQEIINRPVARLFGPAIFEASKLKVLHVGTVADEGKAGGLSLPRAYTLTHSDITSKITLAISNTINHAQLRGWCNRVQRDEVVAEWRKIRGAMSLHVHCHISGGHFFLDLLANLRYYVFCKELPVVLKAFAYGDSKLFNSYPELEDALVWVYFHSNNPNFNRVECWGPLRDAVTGRHGSAPCSSDELSPPAVELCKTEGCECCFPPNSLIPWPDNFQDDDLSASQYQQQ